MAHNLIPLLRSYAGDQPGRGVNQQSGLPSNSKERVSCIVNITSYTTGGETVTPAEMGLKSIDFFDVTAVSINNGTFPTGTNPLWAAWNSSNNNLIMGLVHGGLEATSGQAAVAVIEASGEGAHDAVAL